MSAFGGNELVSILSPSQELVHHRLGSQLQAALGAGTRSWEAVGVDPYEGQIVPGSNYNLDTAFGRAADASSPVQGLQGAVQQALSGAGDPEGVRQMYQDQLLPAQFAYEDQMRSVRNRYGDTYGKTGALPYMEALGAARFGADQNQILGQLTYRDRQAAADRQANAINPAVNMQQGNVTANNALAQMGFGERSIDLQQNAEDFQKWDMSRAYNNPWLQLLGIHQGTQTMGQQQQPNQVAAFTEALGGLAGVAGAFG